MSGMVGPGAGVAAGVEDALSILVGERLRYLGRAADLAWIGFGDDVEVRSELTGAMRTLAEHALHVQCALRIAGPDGPFVGGGDMWIWPDPGAADRERPDVGEALFDRRADQLASVVDTGLVTVATIQADDWGGFVLLCSHGWSVEVFPDTTVSEEQWRYFRPGDHDSHFVVFDEEEASK
jgi:hypothetical protein